MKHKTKTTQQKKKTIKNKLDHIIQQVYREETDRCLVCGERAEVLHHYVQKKQSTYLRWNSKNLVLLCNSCHCKHHISGDPNINATIVRKMGWEWVDYIEAHRRDICKDSLEYLRELLAELRELGLER